MVQKNTGDKRGGSADPYISRVKRRDFVRLLAARLNLSAKDVSNFIDAFANEIADLNADGKCVDVWGFGRFDLVWWGADKVNNLKGCKAHGRYVPTFRPSTTFRELLRDSMVSVTRRQREAEEPVVKKVKLRNKGPQPVVESA